VTLTRADITYLVGGKSEESRPFIPFNDLQCEFLNTLSVSLRKDSEAQGYPDVLTFAFWCRKGNIFRLRDEFQDGRSRLGLGKVFHVAPSNVPVNFAFTYVFGLLAGNTNYVRLPSKKFPQVDIICRVLNEVLALPEYKALQAVSHLFRYDHQSDLTAQFSAQSQGRVIWGGDETIREIRESPIQIRGIDLAFSDRYSICCLGGKTLVAMSDAELDRLATSFYNDTYLMDQNACSSPHLILWIGEFAEVALAQEKFWGRVTGIVHQRYQVSAKAAVDKLALFCKNAIELDQIQKFQVSNTALFRIQLGTLPPKIDSIRGNSGYFYEYQTTDLDLVAGIVTSTYQTLTYAGLEKGYLSDFVLRNRLRGIDRIVPVGSALDMGVIWDGHHVIKSLSRIIDLR